MFTLMVKDLSGNQVSSLLLVHTLKKSAYFGTPNVSYGVEFSIVRNAVSNKLRIDIPNGSSSQKTLKSIKANLGQFGSAVKMMRYKDNVGKWIKLTATTDSGDVEFSNLILAPGLNTLETYFSIKTNASVATGSPLKFKITSIDDGEGAILPVSGTFGGYITVGSVNTVQTPTEVLTTGGITFVSLNGSIQGLPNSAYTQSSIFTFNFQLKGPDGARVHAIRLMNPFSAFQALEFDQNGWVYDNNRLVSPYEQFTSLS